MMSDSIRWWWCWWK